MNIVERADKYADGKANEAITKAIAQAYLDGFRDGYKEREMEIPVDFRDNRTQYVDLGLPSGTLWADDYERIDGIWLYVPYERAESMKIPTEEQWLELLSCCKWELVRYSSDDYRLESMTCIGPNGNFIRFERTGMKIADLKKEPYQMFFWLEGSDAENQVNSIRVINAKEHSLEYARNYVFPGYRLPVRLVR